MINSKEEFKEYLEADRMALGRKKKPDFLDLVWKYEISLRNYEYYHNCRKGILWKPVRLLYRLKFEFFSIICGYTIPINRIGKGLSISDRGTIVMNSGASIGENCRLHVCVNIGTAAGCEQIAPKIGDNVYIAPGVKLCGDIEIASGIIIGANSVVNKSFTEEIICIAGVPARKISDIGRFGIEKRNRLKYGE